MNPQELRDRFRGCLLGMAIGDALGAASEFMKERQVRETFGVLKDYFPAQAFDAGEFTDDTSMALAVAESIIEAECVDVETIADAFVQWMTADGRGIGILTMHSLRLIDSGLSPLQAGQRAWERSGKTSAGNGAVMRCAPIGLYDWRDPDDLVRDSILVSRITHYDPRCCLSCVAVNSAIAAVLNEEPEPLEAALRSIKGECLELENALEIARQEDVAAMRLDGQNMGYTILTTQAAFAALEHYDNFEKAIIAVVNKGGDADTNAAVAGALLGTQYGCAGLPERWVEGLVDRERLVAAADALFDLANV